MAPIAQTPAKLIASIPEPKRGEVSRLHTIIQSELPGAGAEVASGMIGYGKFKYRYASGREGESFKVSLASNKGGISIYINAVDEGGYLAEQAATRLGRAKVGKSCIRVASLDDLSIAGLTEVLRKARVTPGAGEVGAAPPQAAASKASASKPTPNKPSASKALPRTATPAKPSRNARAGRKSAVQKRGG